MAVLNPDHLFEQAAKLTAPPPAGPPRQVDLRRAISAAYYGVFHYIITAAADEFVGVTKKASRRYTLVYHSVDHRALRDLCNEAKKQQLSAKYLKYAPTGFDTNIQAFASAVVELQEKSAIQPTMIHRFDLSRQTRFWLWLLRGVRSNDSRGLVEADAGCFLLSSFSRLGR